MLIHFHFSNYKSFRDGVEFSMVADKYLNHRDSLMRIPGQRYAKVLPLAAVYGGNASGKTGFVSALKALKTTIATGDLSVLEPFLLDSEQAVCPSCFCICFFQDGQVYEYTLEVQGGRVQREELLNRTKPREQCLFRRCPGAALESDLLTDSRDAEQVYVRQMGGSLPDTQLLLTTIHRLQPRAIYAATAPCFTWFFITLCIIGADSKRVGLGFDLLQDLELYQEALQQADTGIEELSLKSVDAAASVPADMLESFRQSADDVMVTPEDASLVLFKNEKGVNAVRCYSTHRTEDGRRVDFPLAKESDGTRRYMHLLPILLDTALPRVYVVDELDRSLHHQLSRALVSHCRENIRSGRQQLQLIFTTHDALLLSKDTLRKDEVWVAERDGERVSHLTSFNDYKDVRADANILKSYLEGRMGGLPHIYRVS
ncbi:MAG: ATP-binding protein [Akkermansia sp.]|nr:ATP-binding protein [Akkermansia sp.]